MYEIGEKVLYPMHGAGTISGIEERVILGEKLSYYVMNMPIGDMTVMIPVKNCDEIGVRYIISCEEAKKALEFFRKLEIDYDDNWNRRHRENMLKLKTGDIFEVFKVVKMLMYMDRKRGLSTSERKMLGVSKQVVISELVLTGVAERSDIESILADTVEEMM